MHLRPPAFSPGFTAFVWAVVFGGFIVLGLLAIGISRPSAVLWGLIAAFAVFFFVRLTGADQVRR
jgi:predicted neutral ceramidase superfamily lipid hydrolase